MYNVVLISPILSSQSSSPSSLTKFLIGVLPLFLSQSSSAGRHMAHLSFKALIKLIEFGFFSTEAERISASLIRYDLFMVEDLKMKSLNRIVASAFRKSSTYPAVSGNFFFFHLQILIRSKNSSLLVNRMNYILEVLPRINFIQLTTLY